jgi:hypothetical protein
MRILMLGLGAGFMALPAISWAQSPQSIENAQGDISVTIYNNNLALVQDVREDDHGRNSLTYPRRFARRQ